MKLTPAFLSLCIAASTFLEAGAHLNLNIKRDSNGLQEVVTWDKHSLFINGERVRLYGGEVHPFRQPSLDLYLDIFQKIRSLGYNMVSFYTFWWLHEPKRGEISFEGFRDLVPFFDAAKKAGIWLIARPGPYINAEVSAGGFPGWAQNTDGLWRTSNSSYVEAYQLYMIEITKVIAQYQITEGGPIILYQTENEYTNYQSPYTEDFVYEQELVKTIRDAGIVIPITHNDASPLGRYVKYVDVWGFDGYPLGFNCASPDQWAPNSVPENYWSSHLKYAPNVPLSIFEFQGGAFDGWGGAGFPKCALLTGANFERVFYKNLLAMGSSTISIYMTYGGTNWGGISHANGYTSYDYGAAVAEDRTIGVKYLEAKLLANFAQVSSALLTAEPQNTGSTLGAFTGNQALKTFQTVDVVGNQTAFYTVRQADASLITVQKYKLTVKTSAGDVTIPTLGGDLTLNGKDAKIHVVDYLAGSTQLVYSSAEVFTWATIDKQDIVVLYGGAGELHEFAVQYTGEAPTAKVVSGSDIIKQQASNGVLTVQFTANGQTVVDVGAAKFFLVDRETAYQFWVLYLPGQGNFASFSTANPIIVKGGYYLRNVNVKGSTLSIAGDLNVTTTFEIIAPAAQSKHILFNGSPIPAKKSGYGTLLATKQVALPPVTLPDLSTLAWKSADSLPEITSAYDDSKWTVANQTETVNPNKPTTPTILYGHNYGFHTGNLLWRGHFEATGSETAFVTDVWGGLAFGYTVWLDGTYLGSWEGDAPSANKERSFSLPTALAAGSKHVITILQDHMGYDEDWWAASDSFRAPRGIRSYSFAGSTSTSVEWRVTGNLGGESYPDEVRGALNEGGLYGERQGWHLPGFDDSKWAVGKPTDGIKAAGVNFYRTSFTLNVPSGVDYPIAIVTKNSTANPHFRAQFYVNGYQFGKYANAIGPQTSFPIPEGVLHHNGVNTLAVSLWAHDGTGAALNTLTLETTKRVISSKGKISNIPAPKWTPRPGAY
ncbi:glycoside hydrolase superfamily [Auriculariales sp. MPI-PUGE-AT-0066]|nr:glycoside hydrolase superfamily [Auriculariales sp. MPI-PUGE-AT-0066]